MPEVLHRAWLRFLLKLSLPDDQPEVDDSFYSPWYPRFLGIISAAMMGAGVYQGITTPQLSVAVAMGVSFIVCVGLRALSLYAKGNQDTIRRKLSG